MLKEVSKRRVAAPFPHFTLLNSPALIFGHNICLFFPLWYSKYSDITLLVISAWPNCSALNIYPQLENRQASISVLCYFCCITVRQNLLSFGIHFYISDINVTNWQFNKYLSASKGEPSCHVWNLGANAVTQRIKKKYPSLSHTNAVDTNVISHSDVVSLSHLCEAGGGIRMLIVQFLRKAWGQALSWRCAAEPLLAGLVIKSAKLLSTLILPGAQSTIKKKNCMGKCLCNSRYLILTGGFCGLKIPFSVIHW